MSEVQRYMVSYATGLGESAMPSETGNRVKFTDHAARVRELEEAVRVLAEMVSEWEIACDIAGAWDHKRNALILSRMQKGVRSSNAFEQAIMHRMNNPIAADAVKEAGR